MECGIGIWHPPGQEKPPVGALLVQCDSIKLERIQHPGVLRNAGERTQRHRTMSAARQGTEPTRTGPAAGSIYHRPRSPSVPPNEPRSPTATSQIPYPIWSSRPMSHVPCTRSHVASPIIHPVRPPTSAIPPRIFAHLSSDVFDNLVAAWLGGACRWWWSTSCTRCPPSAPPYLVTPNYMCT